MGSKPSLSKRGRDKLRVARRMMADGIGIIALKRRSKQPDPRFCPNGSYNATTEMDVVRQWLVEDDRINLAGVLLGTSYLVVDVDGPEGVKAAKKLGPLPRTLMTRTPNGTHRFYRHDGKVKEKGPADESLRSGITSTISLFATPDMKLTGISSTNKTAYAESRADYLRVYDIMETELRALTGGKRKPTDAEYNQAFHSATRTVVLKFDTSFLGMSTGQRTAEKRRYELEAEDIPGSVRQRIANSYKRVYGSEPDEEALARMYRRYKGVHW